MICIPLPRSKVVKKIHSTRLRKRVSVTIRFNPFLRLLHARTAHNIHNNIIGTMSSPQVQPSQSALTAELLHQAPTLHEREHQAEGQANHIQNDEDEAQEAQRQALLANLTEMQRPQGIPTSYFQRNQHFDMMQEEDSEDDSDDDVDEEQMDMDDLLLMELEELLERYIKEKQ